MNGATKFFHHNAAAFGENYRHDNDFAQRYRIWTELIAQHAGRPGTAFDFGCGTGVLSFHLAEAGWRVVGVDGAPRMIELCRAAAAERQVTSVTFVEATLPLVEASAAVGSEPARLIVCSSVLEYLDDLDGALAQVSSFLAPNGIFIASLPNRQSLHRKFEKIRFRLTARPSYYRFVRQVLSSQEFAARGRAHGLDMLDVRYYGHGPLLSRVAHGRLPKSRSENLYAAVFQKTRRA